LKKKKRCGKREGVVRRVACFVKKVSFGGIETVGVREWQNGVIGRAREEKRGGWRGRWGWSAPFESLGSKKTNTSEREKTGVNLGLCNWAGGGRNRGTQKVL